ncbi:MAG TPA: peptidoglycan editing factor PgeF [Kofleriaceae bacterium]|jgi:YfiH family protein|nr:peptidoglycan editing factor PgeF [Kofleriaceae bacterium]
MSDHAPIRVLRSPVIPSGPGEFVHGFPERTGGVSTALRSSLNLGFRWGDDRALVERNRALLAAHEGFALSDLQVTRHVHGTNVWKVGEPAPESLEFDGLVCDHPGPVLGAFAADCVPILFADPVARVCGAAHAGWRGAVAGVAENVVTRMVELGSRPADIRIALGPSIGPCCFEVGPEVVAPFRARFGDAPGLVVPGPAKDHLDLRVALTLALTAVGVARDHLDAAPPCTRCHPDRFFSYRRDGLEGGVHMGFIGLRPR